MYTATRPILFNGRPFNIGDPIDGIPPKAMARLLEQRKIAPMAAQQSPPKKK